MNRISDSILKVDLSLNDEVAVISESIRLNCVDLFAGAGGFSLAAKKAGMKVVAAVELNKHACDTYKYNLIDNCKDDEKTELYSEDITVLSPQQLIANHFADGKSCDIVLGGPPCQGFSVHRINGAGIDDPRNRLVLRYFDYVQSLSPKVFLMENVPGILWPRHRKFLEEFYNQSKKAKYRILGPVKLDARDYGVPQRRQRVFILGVRENIAFDDSLWPPKPTHADPRISSNLELLPWVDSSKIFEASSVKHDENDVHMNHTAALIDVFKATPPNGSRKDSNRTLPCHEKHSGHSDVYGRININEPGPTMTTACINPSKGRFVHPSEHHGITVRQAARFQTFPDCYMFKGGLIAAGVQIGNAVPVDLGRILLKAIENGLSK